MELGGASSLGGEGRGFLRGRGGTSSVGRGKEEQHPLEGRSFLLGWGAAGLPHREGAGLPPWGGVRRSLFRERGGALPASLAPSIAHDTLRTSLPATGLAAARPPN